MPAGADPELTKLRQTNMMLSLGRGINDLLNGKGEAPAQAKHGFMLITYDSVTLGNIDYVTNTERAQMLTVLKKLQARLEGRFHETAGKQ